MALTELSHSWLVMVSGSQSSRRTRFLAGELEGCGKARFQAQTVKYKEEFKEWEQKTFLEALPGQCVKRWLTHFASMNGRIWVAPTSPGGFDSAKNHYSGITREGRAQPYPSPASTYLHRLCQDISPAARKSSSQFCQVHLLGGP